jgi:SOS response regulatory protein OraA/RecX
VTESRKTVTALRERPRDLVDVEVDGSPWRTLPAEVVVRSGLLVGRELDRETARSVARELRRSRALGVAVVALRHRDLSSRRLDERLAARGIAAGARVDALAALERTGVLDDGRAAAGRAGGLARRGHGDAAIRFRLEQEGFPPGAVAAAIARLEPEAERARELVARRGRGASTARWLAARGFGEDVVEAAAGELAPGP